MTLPHALRLFIIIALSQSALAHQDSLQSKETKKNEWSEIKTPIIGQAQAIGSYANGCQVGAVFMPEEGEGYVSIRRWRNRFYTQPVTLDLTRYIGQAVSAHGERILVGDSSQAIGGTMPYGHSSHQNGLDVDFWFYTQKTPSALPDPNLQPPTMVNFKAGIMQSALWKPSYRDALYAAATYPETTRVFVNPVIKQHLCRTETDKSWLYKIRPWSGHDSHFHVRLECPFDSPLCERQEPVPLNDGCDADLDKWVLEQTEAVNNPKPAKKPNTPKKPKPKPEACMILLQQAQHHHG
ncbi:MAG: penicillin-insensitive murein endopeptidase [Cardiobacteriaceae bacterium]|nr:penicillin-insensitive murein endopeptidase [Cardiobacteriaceae bacterium]